ncbi:MAG: Gfo/Idh/MocA family oxidoreductase [Fuerstiella sp.]|nr:Gfo/Idh/MocA family oxidoreductase [Fuerstiella sp.]
MNSNRQSTRRDMLRKSVPAAIPLFVPSHVLGGRGRVGANDRIHIGVIGTGARGKYLIANVPPAGRVVSLCDCSLSRIDQTRHPTGKFAKPLAQFRESEARHCTSYQDYRQMLDREKLDAVIIATPDHHHAQAALLAFQAQLDVYVEKPLALTIAEGRAMVEAAKRHKCIVQVGSQQRTMQVNRFACEFVRDGGLGKLSRIDVPNFPGPIPYDHLENQPVPDDLDWTLFLGPTPMRTHHRKLWVKDEFKVGNLLWRGWDFWQDYSGHGMTNWGAHRLDMVHYALGIDEGGPVEIRPQKKLINPALADRWKKVTVPFGTLKNREADEMRFCPVTMLYDNGVELRFHPDAEDAVFYGDRGKLLIKRNDYRAEPADLIPAPDPQEQARWKGAGFVARPHIENWLDCIRSRKTPNAPVEVGHGAATVCHLANIVRELGRPLHWDARNEVFLGDDEANQCLRRPRRKGFELPT